jgi:hypothetical protein
MEIMPPLTTFDFFAGPLVGFVVVGVLALVLKWSTSRKGGSLVRRVDGKPAEPDMFGLLTDVHTTSVYADARRCIELLTQAGIKATAARTTKGWKVYVWPADRDRARDLIRQSQP